MRQFQKNNMPEILAAFLLAGTLFFFAPITVYIENAKLLPIHLVDIWYFYFLATLVVFLILFAAILLLKRVFPYIALLFTALSIGFILQGNFLILDLGVLDGHEIAWDSFGFRPHFELILWVVFVAGFLIFRRPLIRHYTSIFALLIFYQVSTCATAILSNPLPPKRDSIYFSFEKEFEFSRDKNVILIILDTFRSEAFQAVLDRYPEYRETFQDFIYFQDAVGGYPTTRPSIPLILTGEYYDNSIPLSKFITASEAKNIPLLLKKNGFIVEVYSSIAPYDKRMFDNLTSRMPFSDLESQVMKQYIISGIRYMPFVLKRFFVTQYYQGQDYYHKDMVVFANRVRNTNVIDRESTFKIYHLSGAHPPFQLDNALNQVDKGYIEQAASSLRIVKELISELKDAGGYDNSLIIIIGDHGSHDLWEYPGTTIAYSTQSLVLVKRVNQQFEEIQVSDSRVSIADIPKSIAKELGIENSYSGYSIFEPIPSDRTRKFFYYEWKHSDWFADYIPHMYEFEIRGSASHWNSYTLIEEHPGNNEGANPSPLIYQYGENIVDIVLANDVYRRFLSNRFDYEQTTEGVTWVWASGPKACINIPVNAIKKELALLIQAEPFIIQNQLDDQRIIVSIDKHVLAKFQKNDAMEMVIPSELTEDITRDLKVRICFEFPDALKSPKDYGLNNDPRLLGYTFKSIILTQVATDR